MRPVLYRVAASLDGYIAGPQGEVDWIVGDASDLAALYEGVDTVLLGRRTFELTLQPGAPPWPANDWIAVGLGLLVYVTTLLWAHVRLIGVAPLG